MEGTGFFRVEVQVFRSTPEFADMDISEFVLHDNKNSLYSIVPMSINLYNLINYNFHRAVPGAYCLIDKVRDLGIIDFSPVMLDDGKGSHLFLYHSYDDFMEQLDELLSKSDLSILGYRSYSFKNRSYGIRN